MTASKRPVSSLLAYFYKNYRAAIITGMITIIVIDCGELLMPLILKNLVDSVSGHYSQTLVRSSLYAVGMVVLVQVIGRYLWRVSLAKGAMAAGADLRRLFSSQIFEGLFRDIQRRKVGQLMTLATSDVENMRTALGPGLISLVDALFYCFTIPFAMMMLAPHITLKILIPLLGIPFLVIFLQKKIYERSSQVQLQMGRLGTLTQEVIAGVRLAKVYGAERELSERMQSQSHELNVTQVDLSKTQSIFGPSLEFFLSVTLVLLFGMGTGLSVGTLVALQRFVQKLMWPMTALGMSIIYFQKARASGVDFFQFLEEPKGESLEKVGEWTPLSGTPVIEARDLSFGVISHLSFKVKQGEWVGIEGRVASGKSTLFSLLLRFVDPPRGQLFMNGVDILDWDIQTLRQSFASVLQEPYLFQGSIQSNLEVGSEVSIQEALRIAGVDGELSTTRLDAHLGEMGTALSGGQKQRVAIARALRKGAPIMLFDDPLSSVDSATATRVLNELHRKLRENQKTVIMVSHRLEHLAHCDQIISLSVGSSE